MRTRTRLSEYKQPLGSERFPVSQQPYIRLVLKDAYRDDGLSDLKPMITPETWESIPTPTVQGDKDGPS